MATQVSLAGGGSIGHIFRSPNYCTDWAETWEDDNWYEILGLATDGNGVWCYVAGPWIYRSIDDGVSSSLWTAHPLR